MLIFFSILQKKICPKRSSRFIEQTLFFCGGAFSLLGASMAAPQRPLQWTTTPLQLSVNGVEASADLLKIYLQRLPSAIPADPKVRVRRLRSALRPLVERLLLQEALTRQTLTMDERAVDERLERARHRSGGLDQWRHRLAQRASSPALERERFWREIALKRLALADPRMQANEATLRERYQSLQARYNQPAQTRARHIFLALKAGASDEVRAARREELLKIRDALSSPGMTMEQLARRYSEDESQHRGGLLQPFSAGEMLPGFEAAADRLEVGEVSDVVESAIGFHLIRVEARSAAKQISFESARAELLKHFQAKRGPRIRRELISSLWRAAVIHGPVDWPALEQD
ncbi:MAG: peptidylprolyl isomerase [Myxococcota bacterium]|nr:peptidylprolyl isomerase [Myxococcota bacterium]